jgi:hypothetical protein
VLLRNVSTRSSLSLADHPQMQQTRSLEYEDAIDEKCIAMGAWSSRRCDSSGLCWACMSVIGRVCPRLKAVQASSQNSACGPGYQLQPLTLRSLFHRVTIRDFTVIRSLHYTLLLVCTRELAAALSSYQAAASSFSGLLLIVYTYHTSTRIDASFALRRTWRARHHQLR